METKPFRLNSIKKLNYYRFNYDVVIIALISLLGFLWHFYGSVSAYLEYGTKVSFALEEPKGFQYEYPGITLCFRSVVPYWKLVDRYPDLAEDVQSVKDEMIARNDTIFWSKNESKIYTKAGVWGKKLKDYYESQLKDKTTVLDILENWGNDLEMKCRALSLPLIDRQINKTMFCNEISEVIETVNYKYRCFTYLSQLKANKRPENDSLMFTTSVFFSKKDFESRKEDMAHIGIETNISKPLTPFDDSFNVRIAIHSPKMIPFPGIYTNNRLMGRWGRHYDIFFSKTVSHLLKPPFATNCQDYSQTSDGSAVVESYDMCVTHCILNMYRDLCQCLPRYGLIYSKSLLGSDDRFCAKENLCQTMHIRQHCLITCKPDCLQEQFTTEIMSDVPWLDLQNASAIKVGRKPVPDNVYRHSPAMSWVQLVSDIGGLGGLWLGFSVIAVSKTLFAFVKTVTKNVKSDENILKTI